MVKARTAAVQDPTTSDFEGEILGYAKTLLGALVPNVNEVVRHQAILTGRGGYKFPADVSFSIDGHVFLVDCDGTSHTQTMQDRAWQAAKAEAAAATVAARATATGASSSSSSAQHPAAASSSTTAAAAARVAAAAAAAGTTGQVSVVINAKTLARNALNRSNGYTVWCVPRYHLHTYDVPMRLVYMAKLMAPLLRPLAQQKLQEAYSAHNHPDVRDGLIRNARLYYDAALLA